MKFGTTILVGVCLLLLLERSTLNAQPLATAPSTLNAQFSTNRVLDLDGKDSYVELPPNIFNDLTEATVEGWVKWRSFGSASRFFDFGAKWHAMFVWNFGPTSDLGFRFHLVEGWGTEHDARIPGLLQLDQWCHIAAVSGKRGMELYFNGVLVATDPFTGSFAAIKNGDHNWLGRSNWEVDAFFAGQMDEVRVWKFARTEQQIRDNMFNNLTGREEGLVGVWNFNDGTPNDASTNTHHGKLMGNAKVVEAKRPTTVLYGTVTDPNGTALPNARIALEQSGSTISEATNNATGTFSLAIYPNAAPYDLSVVSGDLGARRTGLTFQPGERRQMELQLQSAVSISGSVLALDNSPQALVVVQVVEAVSGSAGVLNPGRS